MVQIGLFVPVIVALQADASGPTKCGENPDRLTWFVQSGAPSETGIGTEARPFSSLAEAQSCSDEGTTISILPASPGSPPLDGGIVLKNGQKLLGPASGRTPAGTASWPSITNTRGPGDVVVLGNDNEVAYLHIDSPVGAAILGDNVAGANLHDLRITREHGVVPPTSVDASLCHVVMIADSVDNAASTLRGCHVFIGPIQKSPITLLADDRATRASIVHTVRRVTILDNPAADNLDLLSSAGVYVIVAGHVDLTLNIEATSIENSFRGIIARATDRATVTLNVRDTRMDNLTSDGINIQTGFVCSGMKKGDVIEALNVQCSVSTPRGPLPPAPVSDAKVVLNVVRFRFADTQRKGRPEAGAIEPVALDQERSVIEVHVEESDLIGAAGPGFFTWYVPGRPARDIIDFGCVNPNPGDPAQIGRDPGACRARGFTSAGRNRIFGNSAKQPANPLMEVALAGPGRMMAQGNYWGDVHPRDGSGDALGQCSVWDADERLVRVVPNSRCKLYNIAQGNPEWIDGRFHLPEDPRR